MTNPHRRYRNAAAFQMALNKVLKSRAAATGQPVADLRRQFLVQRFLARVFVGSESWVLTGGNGLLVRIVGARHSDDVDLIRRDDDMHTAVDDLRRISGPSPLDPFTFDVGRPTEMHGLTGGVTVRVQVYLGAVRMGSFPIDIAAGPALVGSIEYRTPEAVITISDVAALPPYPMVAMEDQVASKVAAMVSLYGASKSVSTRFHDLADLVLIVCACSLDAATTATALRTQFQRRGLTVQSLVVPGSQWAAGYLRIARTIASLPEQAREVDGAISLVGSCLDPVLAGSRTHGRWDPAAREWL